MSAMMALTVAASVAALPAAADPLPRAEPAAGSVIDRKMGEEVRFVDLSNWQNVDLHQDLLGGDVLRTNATGQLAILFADRTQVRLGRNSALQVKKMARDGDTILNLQSGTMWARAQRGGTGLTVETPAAAAAIRGTHRNGTGAQEAQQIDVMAGGIGEPSIALAPHRRQPVRIRFPDWEALAPAFRRPDMRRGRHAVRT